MIIAEMQITNTPPMTPPTIAPTGAGPGVGVVTGGVGDPREVEGEVGDEVEGKVEVVGGDVDVDVGVGGTGSESEVDHPDGYCVPVLIPLGPRNIGWAIGAVWPM